MTGYGNILKVGQSLYRRPENLRQSARSAAGAMNREDGSGGGVQGSPSRLLSRVAARRSGSARAHLTVTLSDCFESLTVFHAAGAV